MIHKWKELMRRTANRKCSFILIRGKTMIGNRCEEFDGSINFLPLAFSRMISSSLSYFQHFPFHELYCYNGHQYLYFSIQQLFPVLIIYNSEKCLRFILLPVLISDPLQKQSHRNFTNACKFAS